MCRRRQHCRCEGGAGGVSGGEGRCDPCVLPVGVPAVTTAARMVEMVPEVMDRVERFIDKRKEEKESF